jgi:hypothetical protein
MNITEIDTGAILGEKQQFDVRYVPELQLGSIKGRIIRNPGYGGPDSGIYGWPTTDCVSRNRKPRFMAALAKDIRANGFRNPVVCYSTPTGVWLSFGGSRVEAGRIAEAGTIPAIINDYTGDFAEYKEVTNANWSECFTDVPEYAEFTDTGFDTHYSLERNRRDRYDPAGMKWAEGKDFVREEFPWLSQTQE